MLIPRQSKLKIQPGSIQERKRPLYRVQVGKKTAWVGFLWKTVAKNPKFSSHLLREILQQELADTWVYDGTQVGLGNRLEGKIGGGRSLACLMREALRGNKEKVAKGSSEKDAQGETLLAIFALTSGKQTPIYWLYAQRAGLFIPGYHDAVFESLAEAKRAYDEIDALYNMREQSRAAISFLEELGLVGLSAGLKECEKEGESCALQETSQQELLQFSETWEKYLYDLSMRSRILNLGLVYDISSCTLPVMRRIKQTISLGLVLGVLGFLGHLASQVIEEFGLIELSNKQQEAIKVRQKELQEHPEYLFREDWPPPQSTRQCLDLAYTTLNTKIALIYAGWKLKTATCQFKQEGTDLVGVIAADYVHSPMASYATLGENVRIKPDGKAITQQFTIGRVQLKTNRPKSSALLSGRAWQQLFYELAQRYKLKTNLSLGQAKTRTLKDLGSFTCPWGQGTFSITTIRQRQWASIREVLSRCVGLQITKVGLEQGQWQVHGRIWHHKL